LLPKPHTAHCSKEKFMHLKIVDVVGANCISLEDGERLFSVIHPALKAGQKVSLDFAQISVFASPFFNSSVGRLLADLAPDDLNERLEVLNLDPDGLLVLKRVIQNSREFYASPAARESVRRMLDQRAEDDA
jgi:hypothetical protein